jgi:hypothetical protein
MLASHLGLTMQEVKDIWIKDIYPKISSHQKLAGSYLWTH